MADSDKIFFVAPQTMSLALTDYSLFTKHKLDGLSICQFAKPLAENLRSVAHSNLFIKNIEYWQTCIQCFKLHFPRIIKEYCDISFF